MGFIIYMLIVFLNTVQNTTRKAYTDSRTGLVNRTRWNELMNNDNSIPEPYAILMMDLNGLKQMNDTLGHEAGDQMIFQLSNILRNTLFLSTQHGKSVNSFRGWPICFLAITAQQLRQSPVN